MLDLVTTTSWSAVDYLAAVPSRAEVFVLCGAAYAVLYRHDARIAVLNRRLTRFLAVMSGAVREHRLQAYAMGAAAERVSLAAPAEPAPDGLSLTQRLMSAFVQAMEAETPAAIQADMAADAGPAEPARVPPSAPGPHFAFGIMPERHRTPADEGRMGRLHPLPAVSQRAEAAAGSPVAEACVMQAARARPVAAPVEARAPGPTPPEHLVRSWRVEPRPADGLPDRRAAKPAAPHHHHQAEADDLDGLGAPLGLGIPSKLQTAAASPDAYAEAYRLSLAARIEHEQRLQKLLTDRTEALARRTAAAEPAARPRKVAAAVGAALPSSWSWNAALPMATEPYETALGGV